MLRYLSRLKVQTQLSVVDRSFAQIYSGQKKIERKKVNYKDDNKLVQSSSYYLESDRHEMFQRSSSLVYQFDDETRNITTWDYTKPEQDYSWNQATANYDNDELIQAFESLLKHCTSNNISLSDPQFNTFIDDFTERLQIFTLNELIRVLQSFTRFPLDKHRVRQRNYIELFHALDQACTIQSQDLLPEQLLFISSIWLSMPMAKRTYFTQLVGRLFNRYLKTMTAPQMAQALFYINCMQQKIIDIRAFENIFEERINDLTIEEFSTVLWTFIRLDTKLEKQELRDRFFEYLEKQDLTRLSDPMLSKILIMTSRIHTKTKAKTPQWMKISEALRSNMEARLLKTCILMANIGVPIRLFDDQVILNVFQRCLNHPEEFEGLSMHDLEYLSRILCMSNYSDREMIRKIGNLLLTEIKNRLEYVALRGFYTNFINIIRNLTLIHIYDLEMMENLFRPEYIRFIHKNSKQVDMPLYELDGYNRINLKCIYKGHLLPDNYLERICYLVDWVPDRVERYRKHHEFVYAIEDIVRKHFTHCQYAHAVAHRKAADLLVCVNKNTLEAVDISKNFPPLYQGKSIEANTLTKNDPNLMVFAFTAGNTKEYSTDYRNKCEDVPIGHLAQKIEQLELLGFLPIVVPIRFWGEKSHDGTSLERFIVDEVNRHLHSLSIEKQL